MTYNEFTDWMEINTPEGEDREVLTEFLASLAAELVNMGAQNNAVTPKQFLTDFLNEKFDRFTRH